MRRTAFENPSLNLYLITDGAEAAGDECDFGSEGLVGVVGGVLFLLTIGRPKKSLTSVVAWIVGLGFGFGGVLTETAGIGVLSFLMTVTASV